MAGASLLAFPNEQAVALAEKLLQLTPGGADRRARVGHSGSDANDCALRVVQAATGRSRFISFIGSYHGNLSGSMSISGHTAMTHTLPRAGLVLLPYPYLYRAEFSADEVLKLLDYQFSTTCPPHQVAAIFIEPVSVRWRTHRAAAGIPASAAGSLRPHGIQIIVDEVEVGLARSGTAALLRTRGPDARPDDLRQAFGGGLPLSAVVGPRPSWIMRRPSRCRPPAAIRLRRRRGARCWRPSTR